MEPILPAGSKFFLTKLVGSYKLDLQLPTKKEVSVVEHLKLCESDYRFMTVIWDHEPLPSGTLVELCAEQLGWKKPTTYTTLRKLCEKGFAKNENTIVSAIIPREQVQAYASEHFVEHTFRGSLPGFLAAFLGGKTISEEDAAALKQLIDAHKE